MTTSKRVHPNRRRRHLNLEQLEARRVFAGLVYDAGPGIADGLVDLSWLNPASSRHVDAVAFSGSEAHGLLEHGLHEHGLHEHGLHEHGRHDAEDHAHDNDMAVLAFGPIQPIDMGAAAKTAETGGASGTAFGSFAAAMSGNLLAPALHSLPGAAASLYLDFDGHFEAVWGQYTNVTSPPLDVDGDATSFNADELTYIEDVWRIVAEDFSPFNINVTTVEPPTLAPGVDPSLANGKALRIAIGGGVEILGLSSGVIGYAYYNSFTSGVANVAYAMPVRSNGTIATAINIGSVASHEAGHSFGLRHQDNGFDIANRWQTIMFPSTFGYEDQYWTAGNNDLDVYQDDMAVVANAINGFGYRSDDHANTTSGASLLTALGTDFVGSGIIATPLDVDVWRLPEGTGESVRVMVHGSVLGQNLDVVVELLDAAGNVVKLADASNSADAEFSLPLAQNQFLRVRSTGEYGRVGQYSLRVTPASPGVDIVAPTTLLVSEGGQTDQFSLSLKSRPTADVMVDVTVSGNNQVAVSQSQLVFTSHNWDQAQVVTVTSLNSLEATGASNFTVELAVQSADGDYHQLPTASLAGIRGDRALAGWVASFQGQSNADTVTIHRAQSTPSNGVVLTGTFRGSVDFDLGWQQRLLTSDGTDGFVAQYDASGNLEWVLPTISANAAYIYALTIDSAGGVYIGGSNSGPELTLGSTTVSTNRGLSDVFLAKLSSDGSVQWAKSWGGTESDALYEVVVDAAANLTLLGHFSGSVDFDPGNGSVLRTSAGSADGYVLRLNSSGNYVGVTTLGGVNYDYPRQMEIDEAGNAYISGYFGTATQLGSYTLTSSGTADGFLLKMTPTGTVAWVKQMVNEAASGLNAELTRSQQGRIYWASPFNGNLNFGPGTPQLTSVGNGDGIVVSVWDDAGNFIDAGIQSSDQESLSLVDLQVDAVGNLVMLGRMRSAADLDLTAGVANYAPIAEQAHFIVRTDSELNLRKTLVMPLTSSSGVPSSLTLDNAGNIFAAGTYRNGVVMPTGDILTNAVSTMAYLAHFKLNPGVAVAATSALETTESGGSVSLGLSLNTAPTSDVVLSLQISDASEGSLTPNQLVFTPSAWNQPQQVTVTGVDDSLMDGDQIYSLILSASSSDPSYNQLPIPNIDVVNRDNDQPQVLFEDSFEVSEWNNLWIEDSQNDWFRSTQRAKAGKYSAEVDGSASNATLTTASSFDLSGLESAELTFDWLIESGFDAGEYLSLDISTNGGASWIQDVRRLSGNVSPENVWHSEAVDLRPYMSANLKVRFRAKVSASDEDANVDNVRISGIVAGPNTPPVANAGSGYVMNEGSSLILSGAASFDTDGSISSFAWDLDNDGQYDDASGPTANFATTASGSHVVGLQVTDNRGATATASTTVTVHNVAPTANAGADQHVTLGTLVSLSAAGSSDPGMDIVGYQWDLDNDGQFDDASGMNTSFTPASTGTYTIRVQVTDADGATSVNQLQLIVSAAPSQTTLFEDSFEVREWNDLWVEDSQNDWFRSTQRARQGSWSAEVDGSATNATLTMASGVNLTGHASVTLTFAWLIESSFDTGEFLALDISTNGGTNWIQNVRRLDGNVSVEDVWHSETVELSGYASSNLKIRFRSSVSSSGEDANVDDVKIIASQTASSLAAMSAASVDLYFAELTKERLRSRLLA